MTILTEKTKTKAHSLPLSILPALAFFLFTITSCGDSDQVELTTSIKGQPWQKTQLKSVRNATDNDEVFSISLQYEQIIDGFGAVFNELGWDALNMISTDEKNEILKGFFSDTGFNFSICRMPIGANDYARDWYSLNDTPGDFDMEHFSTARDRTTLIPYIKEALAIRPDLKVWGSPWCPPAWMKTNNHYACRPDVVNDLTPEGAGKENVTQFIMEQEYLNAYALYFRKYIEAYAREQIDIYAVHVQNEPNSCQNFPSCVWTARDLNTFIGQHLGPAFVEAGLKTEIWYGTIERPSIEKVDTVLQDPVTRQYIDGVGFQWAGKECIPLVHKKYPEMNLMQTESECGNGSNDWPAAEYTWSLIKHYLENGANAYLYWNTILDETGKSMWGWKQNSLISVDSKTGAITRNPEFYLFKHLTHFVKPGAKKLQTPAGFDFGLLFENPDGSVIALMVNDQDEQKPVTLEFHGSSIEFSLPPHSFNTAVL